MKNSFKFGKLTCFARQKIINIMRERAKTTATKFIDENAELRDIIYRYCKDSKFVGCSLTDYYVLYNAIRDVKPSNILECGTGLSTYIILHALRENKNETGTGFNFVSMEQDAKWYSYAMKRMPTEMSRDVEIILSDVDLHHHGMFVGTYYKKTPDMDWNFIFVDGPKQTFNGKDRFCNMDFVRAAEKSCTKICGIIDNRRASVMAYSMLFGPDKITYYPAWNVSTINGVCKDDFVFDDSRWKPFVFEKYFHNTKISAPNMKHLS
ncbi:hypothetical protein SY88_23260 [Clostridiales bacterium PH28_bin88]|nr:hypothetical protein SY88_23260 [Clostridiales bacterium PH28_bin88]